MKKLLSVLLALSMLFSLCVFSAQASTTAAGPTEVTLHTAANQVIISWRNPVGTLKALKVYDGNGTLLSESFDLTSGKIQQYTHTGLTTGTVYNYKLEATLADGSKSVTKLSTKTAAPASVNWMGGDSVQYKLFYSTGVGNSAVFAGFDNNELRSGYPSMLLSNHTGTTLNTTDFLRFNLEKLTVGTEYRLSFEYKAASGSAPALMMNGSWNDVRYISCNGNWQAGSWDFTPEASTYPIYFFLRNAENIWIANIALVVKGTSKNLIPEANPATIYDNASKKASITAAEITSTAGADSITTAWNSSANYFNALKFYIKKSGETEYTYAGETANQKSGSFVFENLTPGDYTVKTARVINGAEYKVEEENLSIAYPVIPAKAPSEITLHTAANQVIISWRNPVYNAGNALTAINVYDGNGSLLSSDFNLTSGKVQSYTNTGLTAGNVYNYKLEAVFADGTKLATKLSTKTVAPTSVNWMGGNEVQYKMYYGTAVANSAVFAGFDNNEKQNNYPSMILSNHTGTTQMSTEFIRISLEKLTAGTKYKLGFSYKSPSGHAPILLMNGWSDTRYISCNGSWQYGAWEFTPTSDKFIIYFLINDVENIWLANLGLYADGSNANLIPEANPATIYDNASKKASITAAEITSTAGADSITTAWNSSANYFNALKFYIKKSGETEYTYAGETANQKSGSFVFDGLELNTAYTVKTARVINGAEYDVKEETITTAEPVVADWSISDYSFKLGESEAAEVTAAGTYSAAVTVTNNKSMEAINAQLIAVVYNNGVLVNVFESEPVSVRKGRNAPATVDVNVADASYDVRLYVWNSLEGMKPLTKASKLY